MSIHVSNLQNKVPVDEGFTEFLAGTIRTVLKTEGQGEEAEVSLVLVEDTYMHELNYKYRGVDSSTDVLSFSMQEGELLPALEEELILGDIVISLPAAERQAREQGHSFHREAACLVIHGVLHLLGYNHMREEEQQVMEQREKEIMDLILLPD